VTVISTATPSSGATDGDSASSGGNHDNNENKKVRQSTWGVRGGDDGDIEMATPRDGAIDNNRPAVKIKAPSSKQQHSHAGFDDNSVVMP